MSLSRTSLLDILYIHFRNPSNATLCRDSSRKEIMRDRVSRALDYFPDMLPSEELRDQMKHFEAIVYPLPETSPEDELPEKVKMAIKTWVISQIYLAIAETLNDQGKIKKELIRLLRWEDITDKISSHGIVTAYIAGIHAQIMKFAATKIDRYHTFAFTQFTTYLHANLGTWVAEVLSKKYGLKVTVPNPISAGTVETILLSVAAGVSIVASLSTIAFFAFRRQNQPSSNEASNMQERKSPQPQL